jgi:N-acetyl-beta-hexosaminidase
LKQKFRKHLRKTKLKLPIPKVIATEELCLTALGISSQITKSGAYSDSETYSVSDIKSLINYGQMHGVIIIPETDMPAHTSSWSNDDPIIYDIDACRNYVYENWRD